MTIDRCFRFLEVIAGHRVQFSFVGEGTVQFGVFQADRSTNGAKLGVGSGSGQGAVRVAQLEDCRLDKRCDSYLDVKCGEAWTRSQKLTVPYFCCVS